MLFITSLKHTVSNFLFPIAVCLFYFFQNFLFRPLSTELFTKNKKYLIFIQKIAQIHQYYIGASMTKTINPEYKLINKICTFECYVKFSFWVSVLLHYLQLYRPEQLRTLSETLEYCFLSDEM